MSELPYKMPFICSVSYTHLNPWVYMTKAEVASSIGLTAGKLLKGQTVLDIAGTATSDANATASQILSGKTVYVNGSKITGTLTVTSVVSFSCLLYTSFGLNKYITIIFNH